jgi:hypothetical protein
MGRKGQKQFYYLLDVRGYSEAEKPEEVDIFTSDSISNR